MLEIAVQDAAGARVALAAGADRVELCCALEVGGLTPSIAMVEACVVEGIPVCVLVRPRAGDFVYTDEEAAIVSNDVRWAVGRGAAAVVLGALRATGSGGVTGRDGVTGSGGVVGELDHLELDVPMLRHWAEVARERNPDVDIVVHRCVDVLLGAGVPVEEVARQLDAIGGVTRVLTSGGADRAGDGAEVLADLAAELDRLGSGIAILAGGGVNPESIPKLAEAGIKEFHLSARREIPTGATGPGGGASTRSVTDAQIVQAAARAASIANGGPGRP
ncbi:copper homeostasis protein CutC [Trueperella pecoris]|uniref:Copper homeostasis protein cutC homolog n=1 Tax=Trueperella pecoris TaxID=2733571 RepID=A0A7M1R142_9ACTO|nr:copper homeostasis protein CutC [Trueperella pecoris]QOR47831.1 copper homeostasis protein CutC [Trueperella pecoris]